MATWQARVDAAARVVLEEVALTLGDQADALLEVPEDPIQARAWHQQRAADGYHSNTREWHLTKLEIARAAGVDPTGNVLGARKNGATWQVIANRLGISRQGAYDRWAKYATEEVLDVEQAAPEGHA